MARYTGPVFKKSRRYKFSTLETGKEFSKGKRREYAPGQHGQMRKKISDYGLHLYEKQKLRYLYGVNERQFATTFKKASKLKGVTGTNFLVVLESRLDNVVYRLGFASTRRQARQLVNHGHFLLKSDKPGQADQKVDIPSMQVKVGQTIVVKEKSQELDAIKMAIEGKPAAAWLTRNKFSGSFDRLPQRSELNKEINEGLIVEYYSK